MRFGRTVRALVTLACTLPGAAVTASTSVSAALPPSAVATETSPAQNGEALAAPAATDGTYIVRFDAGTDPVAEATVFRDAGIQIDVTLEGIFAGAIVRATDAQAGTLRLNADVTSVVPDTYIRLGAPPRSALLASTFQRTPVWGLDRIDQRTQSPSGWFDSSFDGTGVKAYVLDSGVRFDHTEFGSRVLPGAYINALGPLDCDGHGTHVAGTLGGATYGVAKNVSIVPVKVLDCSGGGSMAWILSGLEWIVSNHQTGEPAVLNMSIGGAPNTLVDIAVQAVINDGITAVLAAGNDGINACGVSPARLSAAITVAATDITDYSPNWSNYGGCVDLFAPGVAITSAWITSPTATFVAEGTSMAAPHVAGAAALLLQREPALTPAEVAARLIDNATSGVVTNGGSTNPLLLYVPSLTTIALPPERLLDSRPGALTVDGQFAGIGIRPGGTVTEVQVAGRARVPADAAAAVLNVTVTEPVAGGFATVFPCGTGIPNSSNLNFTAGATIPNAVVAKIGAGGKVCIYSNVDTHLIVDINGYYPAGASFTSLAPARVLDTRPNAVTIDGQFAGAGLAIGGGITDVQVTGRAGVAADASAVVLNVTVTGSAAGGFLTVFPCGTPVPNSSSLNFDPGATIPNAVIVKIGAGGRVCIYSNVAAHVIADINGFYPAGSSFTSLAPARVLDTRAGTATIDGELAGIGVRLVGGITELQISGRAGVPADASAAVLNITVTEPAAGGFLTVFPCGTPVPNSSSLNFAARVTIPNAVIVKIGAGGRVCIYSNAATHLIADINGFYPAGY